MKKKIAGKARKNSDRKVKPKTYESVSQRMGLERLEKSTPKTCRERAALIARKIKRGDVPKDLLPKAKLWVHKYNQRARSLSKNK